MKVDALLKEVDDRAAQLARAEAVLADVPLELPLTDEEQAALRLANEEQAAADAYDAMCREAGLTTDIDIDALLEESGVIIAERDDLKDRLQRLAAEFDNYRKRVEREKTEWAATLTAELLAELLPIADDLERAVVVADVADGMAGAVSPLANGVSLIHRKVIAMLQRNGVEPIEALGQPFDPELHQAVTMEDSDRPDGEVIEQLARGYRQGGRLLRPAMVKVARRVS